MKGWPEEKDENIFFYFHSMLGLEAICPCQSEMRSVGPAEIKSIGKVQTAGR